MPDGTCSVGDCERQRRTRGLCGTHYERLRLRGTTGDAAIKSPGKTTEERLWPRVAEPGSRGCREWQGRRTAQGYGIVWIRVNGRSVQRGAHRIAYELTHGPIPEGLCVCHHCDNPPCCNPAHLFLGTKQDNKDDCISKGRQALGENNGKAKLTVAEVAQIRDLRRYGFFVTELGDLYGVASSAISNICNRKVWRQVP